VFKTNFALMQHHHWSLESLEQMIPWERYIYIQLLQDYLEEKEKERVQREQELKAQMRQSQRRQQ
jgi:hypothetical protein